MIRRIRRTGAHASLRAAASAVLLLALTGCALTPPPPRTVALVGAWQSSLQFKDGPFAAIKDFKFLYVFNAGGTMTESSNYDAVPPTPPAYGEWRATEDNQFEAKYTFFNPQPAKTADSLLANGGWLPGGHGVLVEQIKLAADGRSFESTITVQLFDIAGRQTGGGTAQAHGTRAGF